MRRSIFGIAISLAALCVSLFLNSCENVFPNDKLDNFWRLNRVEYRSGMDFNGEIRDVDTLKSVFYGFSRHLLQVENHSNGGSYWGNTTDTGDSLTLDFSAYQKPENATRYDATKTLAGLKTCGIDSLVTKYSIDRLTRSEMVLSNDHVTLHFEKW